LANRFELNWPDDSVAAVSRSEYWVDSRSVALDGAAERLYPDRSNPNWKVIVRLGRISSYTVRAGYLVLGILMLVLAFIGALLPLMPTTIFLILAVWCFTRSSPRLEAWVLNHPHFGPTLRAWRDQGAISLRAKAMALTGMLVGYVAFFLTVKPGPLLAIGVGILILCCAAYVGSRPLPSAPTRGSDGPNTPVD
jgi:uncharacterized membrane protein YbaN (DUF454 family)